VGSILGIVVVAACLVLGAFIYLLPAIIAYDRLHPQKQAIFALNLLLGWSFLGWAVAMVWAWTNRQASIADLGVKGDSHAPMAIAIAPRIALPTRSAQNGQGGSSDR
jgi:Superinfection immunity protein